MIAKERRGSNEKWKVKKVAVFVWGIFDDGRIRRMWKARKSESK